MAKIVIKSNRMIEYHPEEEQFYLDAEKNYCVVYKDPITDELIDSDYTDDREEAELNAEMKYNYMKYEMHIDKPFVYVAVNVPLRNH